MTTTLPGATPAAEQKPPPAERLLEEVRAGLSREAAGDLAHRGEQRQRPVVGLDRFVRDGRDPAFDECPRQRLVGSDVEVGEEHEALSQAAVLLLDRLLHLEQQLARLPDLVHRHDSGAHCLVGVVGERAPLPRAVLDEHRMAALAELASPGRRQRDAVLVRLDFPGHADFHAGEPYLSRR